ncbi:MAG: glycine--tRNA ligase subunit beta [Nitrospirales bacterium]
MSTVRKVSRGAVKKAASSIRPAVKVKRSRPSPRQSKRPGSLGLPLLLELGTEELPAFFIQPALLQFASLIEKTFKEQRLEYESIRTIGTPRRLTVLVNNLGIKQSSVSQEVMGPPQSVAYDSDGVPTKAAMGFANTQGVPVESLQIRETPKGTYVWAMTHEPGRKTADVLKEHLPKVVHQLSFKKSMKWNESKLRFARPLRWILALYGKKSLGFEIGGIFSGSYTFGHRFLGVPSSKKTQRISISDPASYESMMKRYRVVVDPDERRSLIHEQVSVLAKSVKGTVYADNHEELLDQAVYTVECPQAILGCFDKKYLILPQEVLITAMKEHQGYFSLIGKTGTLLPNFITVTNMKLPKMDIIRLGNERVLTARLSDAQYFFREDRKVTLCDRVKQLQTVTFHQKLGSMHQKVTRLQELVPWIAEAVEYRDKKIVCERAALLAKSDLTTGLVGEFPTLQGVMGREYAKHDGEQTEVSEALGELYLPSTPEGKLPQTSVGICLGLGDRMDSLAAFFLVGMIPSGSEDPFALRRIGYGLIRIIVGKGLRLNLIQLIEQSERIIKSQDESRGQRKASGPSLIDFLLERLRFLAKTTHHVREDMIDAILTARPAAFCDVADLLARMQALQLGSTQPEFAPLIAGYKRANRIVEKEQWRELHINPEILEHEAEIHLYQEVAKAQPLMTTYIIEQNYRAALTQLLQLKTPIDDFFESVMVNVTDSKVRANRLSLLATIDQLFFKVADFSRIQT